MRSRIAARSPQVGAAPRPETDNLDSYLDDAAHYPGGHARGVVRPRSTDEITACLRRTHRILPIGAQSSLTGGATPFGDVVLSTDRLNSISIAGDRARVDAGATLQSLQEALARSGRWFPPAPTYLGAFAGGAVATCAAGAATFKYGTVREWVEGLTLVLAGGDVLTITRGECVASEEGIVEIETSTGVRVVRIPDIRMPDVPKCSAGYFLKPGMDLIDLFIGSEGTLGVIAQVIFKTASKPGAVCRAFVPVATEALAIALTRELRLASQDTWRTPDSGGIDIAAIEHLDARSIALIREDGVDRQLEIVLPSAAAVVLLIDLELPTDDATLWSQLESARDPAAADTPLVRFCRLLDRHGALDDTEIALPADQARAAAFAQLREAVPAGVNRRVALARHSDAAISKTAADMIVRFDRFAEMMAECRRLCADRDLDLAVWGHISDGNVHPNVLPRNAADVEKGREAILQLGTAVIAMGGSPLAEHGVGRNRIKQQLLRKLYGDDGVNAMRAVKLSLDPNGSLASGVIFPTQ